MNDIKTLYNTAVEKAKEGNGSEAALEFIKLAARLPLGCRAPFHLLAAEALLDVGRSDAAIAQCLSAAQDCPDAITYRQLGLTYLERGELQKASDALLRSVTIKPTPTAYVYLASTASDNPRQAEKYLRTAIELDPLFDEAYLNLGLSLIRQGDLDEASAALEKAIAITPDYRQARRLLNDINRLGEN